MSTLTRPADELIYSSARELGGLLTRGEVSAREVVNAHIARIEQVNGELNAVVVRRFDAAPMKPIGSMLPICAVNRWDR